MMYDSYIYSPLHPPSPPYIIPHPDQPYYHSPPLYHSHYQSAQFEEMAQKQRVRFVEPARTPSPTFSSSSFDSPGPLTPVSLPQALPPQVHYPPFQQSAYLTVPQPYDYHKPAPIPSSPAGLQVNSLMNASTHAGASQRPFVWDLRDRPSEVANTRPSQHYDPGYPIPAASLALPTTAPPMDRLEIRCDRLPFRIRVQPSRHYNNLYVTVGDLMSELYANLRLQVSPAEFAQACGGNPDYQRTIEYAYERRIARVRDSGEERRKGIRRVDLLGDYVMFGGFEYMANDKSLLLHLRPRH